MRTLAGKRWSGYLSWHRRRRFVHRREALDALIAAVHAEDPVQILVTGDLVHIGLPAEIEAAAEWLRELGPPERVMLVPGNHDVYARDSWPLVAAAWSPYLGFEGTASDHARYPVGRDLGPAESPIHLVGVSSAVPTALFSAAGYVGDGQLERLERRLASCAGFRCLLIHHPPLPAMTSRRKGLRDAAALEGVLARCGAEIVLHGHVHRNVAREGPRGSRILGTASASSIGGKAGAAYRSIDVERVENGWEVAMRLIGVSADGDSLVLDTQSWSMPATRPASAASGGR